MAGGIVVVGLGPRKRRRGTATRVTKTGLHYRHHLRPRQFGTIAGYDLIPATVPRAHPLRPLSKKAKMPMVCLGPTVMLKSHPLHPSLLHPWP